MRIIKKKFFKNENSCNNSYKKRFSKSKEKNFRKINGTPLYKITLDKLKKCKFDDVYVDSDSEIIKKYCKKNKINFISRKPALAKNSANGNHLLLHHAKLIKADVYFQIFITSHYLKYLQLTNVYKF